jgi:sugar phosphate isomerase/epimerase
MTLPALALAPLSLHRPTSPVMVCAAAAAGYQGVGLRLALPGGKLAPECIDDKALAALGQLTRDEGIEVFEISNVELVADFDLDAARRAIAAGAELGARYLQVVDWDPELARAIDNLGRLTALAVEAELRVAFEFMAYSNAPRIEDARELLATLEPDQGGIILDILHFVRSGGVADALVGSRNDDIAFVQLCDGHADPPPRDRLRNEAVTDRLPPGEGAFPIAGILHALGCQGTISVEAPCRELAGRPLDEQARILHAACSRFLETLEG